MVVCKKNLCIHSPVHICAVWCVYLRGTSVARVKDPVPCALPTKVSRWVQCITVWKTYYITVA